MTYNDLRRSKSIQSPTRAKIISPIANKEEIVDTIQSINNIRVCTRDDIHTSHNQKTQAGQ